MLFLVACTDSKTLAAAPEMQIRNYNGGRAAVSRAWVDAVRNMRHGVVARDLYKGGYWTAVRTAGERLGWDRFLIASAGHGLLFPTDEVPAYSATFSHGHPDSVPGAGVPGHASDWWRTLGGEKRLLAKVVDDDGDGLVCAMPVTYLRSLESVLEVVLPRVRVGRAVILGAPRSPKLRPFGVKLDARATRVVGGAAGQLSGKTLAWLAANGHLDAGWTWDQVNAAVSAIIRGDEASIYPKREPMSDDEVRAWIADVKRDPTVSASVALRRLRDAGRACEERRFRGLFRDTSPERVGAS